MESNSNSTNEKEIGEVKEPPVLFTYVIVGILFLSFVAAGLIVFYIFPSYRDYLKRQALDNYGYEPATLLRQEKDQAELFDYSYIDQEKQLVRRPINQSVPAILDRYKK